MDQKNENFILITCPLNFFLKIQKNTHKILEIIWKKSYENFEKKITLIILVQVVSWDLQKSI